MRITLHIGTWKTGSSAIQQFLARNLRALADQNVFLPSIVDQDLGHTMLYRALREPGPDRGDLIADLNDISARHPDGHAVLSSEHFWPLSEAEIADVAKALQGVTDEIEVLVYLRPQDEMWASIYAQQAKWFRVKPTSPVWGTGDFVGHAILEWALYYDRCLGMFEAAFGAGTVRPRLYRRDQFPGGDVILDFLDYAGIPRSAAYERQEGDTNPSLGWKSVALSLWFVGAVYDDLRQHNDLKALRHGFRAAVGDMAEKGDPDWLGRTPEVLSGEDRRQIRSHYAEDNDRLFAKYFAGEDVFGPPAETTKHDLRHSAIPEREFNKARKRLLRQFRRAKVNLRGREDLFGSPSRLSMDGVKSMLPSFSDRKA